MAGRGGSTLVSHLLHDVAGVVSLSAPDVGTPGVHLRRTPGHGAGPA
jgi:hypothetical protein